MREESLAIFDLDNTLIAGDSDYLWGEYLLEIGVVDPPHREMNSRFYEQYAAGTLDIEEFLRFQFEPLANHSLAELHAWREVFVREKIVPIVLDTARRLVDEHRQRGHILLIVTATNRFITEPIAALFGVENLIATEPEFDGIRYTGRTFGTPSFAEGKVTRLHEWLKARGICPGSSWFYSDSHNDLPLLEKVRHPVAVDPDGLLYRQALERGWPIMHLR